MLPILILLVLLAGCADSRGPDAASDGTLRIGVILPPGADGAALRRGVELGASEAGRAGELIARPFEVRIAEATSARQARRAARQLLGWGAFALVGGTDLASCRALSRAAADARTIFLNVGCREDALREQPEARTFHLEASEWMYARAVAEDSGGADSPQPALWHHGLTRFGAAQLNDRFIDRYGAPPDAPAWAGWMAVKILWEAALRAHTTGADALAAYLLDDNTAFDGHKGQALTFGRADHQLQQPLYLTTLLEGTPVPVEVDPLARSISGLTPDEWDHVTGRGVPEGEYAIVTNEGSGDVSVIDLETSAVVSRIRVGSRPRGVRVTRDGRHVFVALSDDAPTIETDEDAIAVIDLRTGQVIHRHPAGTDPEAFDLSPDGRYLYASNEDAGTATVTDLLTGEVLVTLVVGIEPEGVAVSPDGRWVYVTAETSNTVSVVDARVNRVVASFLVDVRPRAAVFSPTRPRAYVTNEISGTISVVDTDRHQVIDVIELPDAGATPVGVAVSPDGLRLFVANGHAHSVSVIDATTKRHITDVPVGRRPWGIDISRDGRRVYTANGLTNDVSIIDTESLTAVGRVSVGRRPWGVAVTP